MCLKEGRPFTVVKEPLYTCLIICVEVRWVFEKDERVVGNGV